MSRRLRRGATLFAVVLLVGAMGSPVLASEGREVRGGWWATVGAWLDGALEAVGLQPVFEGSACGIDPNGRPIICPGSETIQDDSACGIDPNGRPRPCPSV
jgi:hypothetical protein